MQTGLIKQVRENARRSYDGKNGKVFIHGITVEGDPIEYEYHSLKEKCEKFVPGVEADFDIEVKQNGNYTNHKIVPVNKPTSFGGGGFKKPNKDFDEKRQRTIIAQSSISSAVSYYGETSTKSEDKVFDLAGKIYDWVIKRSE